MGYSKMVVLIVKVARALPNTDDKFGSGAFSKEKMQNDPVLILNR